jgi:hypothetical protein
MKLVSFAAAAAKKKKGGMLNLLIDYISHF